MIDAEDDEKVPCDLCRGTGRLRATGTDAGDDATCHDCDGEGMVIPERGAFAMPFIWHVQRREPATTVEAAERFLDCIGGRIVPDAEDCPNCHGAGIVPEGECGTCKGFGWI